MIGVAVSFLGGLIQAARVPLPGTVRTPAVHAIRSLLALKLLGRARHRHVMPSVFDEGLALFTGLNAIPKRSFLTEYSCRIQPHCYPQLMQHWSDALGTVSIGRGESFHLDFHTIVREWPGPIEGRRPIC
jgi:hypothetical protein